MLFRAAAHEPAPDALLVQIEALLGMDGAEVLHYTDRRRGQRRSMRLAPAAAAEGSAAGEARLEGFLLAGDTSAEAWVKALLQQELPAQAYGRLLLQPGAKPPLAVAARGRQVCSCFDVSEPSIAAALAAQPGPPDAQLQRLQDTLRCGTNCGSCIPELRRLIRVHAQAA